MQMVQRQNEEKEITEQSIKLPKIISNNQHHENEKYYH